MNLKSLAIETEKLMSDVTLGRSWLDGLTRLAHAAGAHSASLSHSVHGRIRMLTNERLSQTMSQFGRDGAPPFTDDLLIKPGKNRSFVSDAEPRFHDRLRKVPLYIEFVVPKGFGWRAVLHLDGPEDPSGLHLTFWRGRQEGAFSQHDLSCLDPLVSVARIAARFSRAQLETLSRDVAAPYEKRGEPVFALDGAGRVKSMNAAAEASRSHLGVTIANGRIIGASSSEQARIQAAIAEATGPAARPGCVALFGRHGHRLQLLVLPVVGEALDVFGATQAIAVILDVDATRRPPAPAVALLRQGFELTEREGEIAAWIAAGESLQSIASIIGIGEGTARNHAKAVLRKTGLHSQSELTALVSRLH